ncbi:hypothetical protein C8R47DRAFT_1166233, partial [Mycena vitilis]
MPFTNASKSSSPFDRFSLLTKKSKRAYGPGSKVVTVSLHRCSSKSRPRTLRSPTESMASGSSSASTSTLRSCIGLVKRGVSAILMMPMPFLDSRKGRQCVEGDSLIQTSEPRGLKRILSRRRQRPNGKRRNSLVLPEVPMPDEPEEADRPVTRRPSECTIRENPPRFEDRTVRFVTHPGTKSRFADDGPAWCDFMVRLPRSPFYSGWLIISFMPSVTSAF